MTPPDPVRRAIHAAAERAPRRKPGGKRENVHMRTMRLLGMTILLSGCGGIGAAPDCSAWRPILVHDDDRLTSETARAILAHNLTGRRVCGW